MLSHLKLFMISTPFILKYSLWILNFSNLSDELFRSLNSWNIKYRLNFVKIDWTFFFYLCIMNYDNPLWFPFPTPNTRFNEFYFFVVFGISRWRNGNFTQQIPRKIFPLSCFLIKTASCFPSLSSCLSWEILEISIQRKIYDRKLSTTTALISIHWEIYEFSLFLSNT